MRVFVSQGWGPQRHSNGESATRAIALLALLTGNIGRAGTNSGLREREAGGSLIAKIPSWDPDNPQGVPKNAVDASISCYSWLNLIYDEKNFMPERSAQDELALAMADRYPLQAAAAKQRPKPNNGIKLLWSHAGNCLANQHGNVNLSHRLLSDPKRCEFIVVCDCFMTDSARYADILLPDVLPVEQLSLVMSGFGDKCRSVVLGGPVQAPPGECRPSYEVNADVAGYFGKREQFTAGKSRLQWMQELYRGIALRNPDLPSWDEMLHQGVYFSPLPTTIAFQREIEDPLNHPFETPSGKIEIYSEVLDQLSATRTLDPGQTIASIPLFDPGVDGYGSVTEEFPLYLSGWHGKSRVNSTFGSEPKLKEADPQRLWINPLDASSRHIEENDRVRVVSPSGAIETRAHVTPRIVPSVVGLAQGAWCSLKPSSQVDEGACINSLNRYQPSPLAHGNGPSNSIIVNVYKLEDC